MVFLVLVAAATAVDYGIAQSNKKIASQKTHPADDMSHVDKSLHTPHMNGGIENKVCDVTMMNGVRNRGIENTGCDVEMEATHTEPQHGVGDVETSTPQPYASGKLHLHGSVIGEEAENSSNSVSLVAGDEYQPGMGVISIFIECLIPYVCQ